MTQENVILIQLVKVPFFGAFYDFARDFTTGMLTAKMYGVYEFVSSVSYHSNI